LIIMIEQHLDLNDRVSKKLKILKD
jgi:hypothetical protein